MPTDVAPADPAATLDLILARCLHSCKDETIGGVRWWVDFPGVRFGPHESREAAVAAILASARRAVKA